MTYLQKPIDQARSKFQLLPHFHPRSHGIADVVQSLLQSQSYGVRLMAYATTGDGRKYWVPQRALTKTPYPGDLDNTVSSNLLSGQKPFDKVVRRAAEEASILEE